MTKEEKERLAFAISKEGFDYAFTNYSNFPNIKDEKFHSLRKKFLDARKELVIYLDSNGIPETGELEED